MRSSRTAISLKVKEEQMGTILLIVSILLLISALPTSPYSSGWGYYPSGGWFDCSSSAPMQFRTSLR